MKFVILSDKHSNLEALLAVKRDFRKREGFEIENRDPNLWRFVSLGDVIGYGPQPNETMIEVARMNPDFEVVGNHEQGTFYAQQFFSWLRSPIKKAWFSATQRKGPSAAMRGTVEESYEGVNPNAKWALRWTAEHLSLNNSKHVSELMTNARYAATDKHNNLLFVHSCPLFPEDMNYVTVKNDPSRREVSAENYLTNARFKNQFIFVGHSHIPFVHGMSGTGLVESSPIGKVNEVSDGIKEYNLSNYTGAIIVVGSVGQPRNHDNRAQYAVFDTDSKVVQFRYVEYDLRKTQSLMHKMKGKYNGISITECPHRLIERLDFAD